jgi:hypothetical protein
MFQNDGKIKVYCEIAAVRRSYCLLGETLIFSAVTQTNGYKLPPFAFRTLTYMSYPWF